MPALTTRAASGSMTDPRSSMSPLWLIPASMIQKSSLPSAASMSRGMPTWLLWFSSVLCVFPTRESTLKRSSFTVVFPAVPVRETTLPRKLFRQARAVAPRAFTVSSTMSTGTSGCRAASSGMGRCASTAQAPFSTAFTAKSCPSTLSPGMQTKSEPGTARRLSVTTEVTTVLFASAGIPDPQASAMVSRHKRI